MRFFKGLFGAVLSLAAFAAGLALVGFSVDHSWVVRFLSRADFLSLDPWIKLWTGLAGGVLVACFILWLMLINQSFRKKAFIRIESQGGRVMVSLAAIEDFIYRTGKEFPEIKELIPSVRVGARGLTVSVEVMYWMGTNLPRISEEFHRLIKNHLEKVVGIGKVLDLEMIVTDLSGTKPSINPPAAREEEEPQRPEEILQ